MSHLFIRKRDFADLFQYGGMLPSRSLGFNLSESRKNRRKQLVEKQLAENTPAENSSEEQRIFSDKYSANFVIVLCY